MQQEAKIVKNQPKLPVQLRNSAVREKVRQWLLAGKNNAYIIKQLEEDTLNIGYKYEYEHARNQLYEVKSQLRQEAAEIKENLVEELTSKLTDLYSKNYAKEDYKECREVINSINKILGLNNGNKVEIAHENEVINIQFN